MCERVDAGRLICHVAAEAARIPYVSNQNRRNGMTVEVGGILEGLTAYYGPKYADKLYG